MVLLVLIIKRGVIDNGGQQMLNMFIDQMSHLLMEPSQIEVLTRTYYNVPSVHKVEPLYCGDNSDCRGVRSHFRVRREVLYTIPYRWIFSKPLYFANFTDLYPFRENCNL